MLLSGIDNLIVLNLSINVYQISAILLGWAAKGGNAIALP